MLRVIAAIILMLIFSILSVAQDSTAPPDPTTLFTDAVEVIEITSISAQMTKNSLTYDNHNNIILIEDKTYPYPDDVYYIYDVIPAGNQQWLLYLGATRFILPLVENFVLFDATTGTFTLPDEVCDGWAKMPVAYGSWVVDDSSGKQQLCFTETGETRDIAWGELADAPLWVESHSPDKRWLLLQSYDDTGFRERSLPIIYSFYGYNLAKDELHLLGTIEDHPFTDFSPLADEWVSNTLGSIIYTTEPGSMADDFYIFDVSLPNSLKFVNSDFGWYDNFKDNPPRFEYAVTHEYLAYEFGGYSSEHDNCSFWRYDATGMYEYDLGYDCEMIDREDGCQVLHPVGDGYVYLQYFESRLPALTYLDTATGKKSEMFAADIESIISVSPDGQYAALLIDNNGITDLKDNRCSEFGRNWAAYGNAWLVILKLFPIDLVYQTEFSTDEYDYPQISANNIFWGENRFLIEQGDIQYLIPVSSGGEAGDNMFWSYPNRLHWVEDGTHSLTYSANFGNMLALSPDITQAIFDSQNYIAHAHLPTMTFTPITHPNAFEGMRVRVSWNDDDTFFFDVADTWRYVLRFKPQD